MRILIVITFITIIAAQTEITDSTKYNTSEQEMPSLNLLDLKYSLYLNDMRFSPNTFNSLDIYLQKDNPNSIIDFNEKMTLKPLQLKYQNEKPGLFTKILGTIQTGAVIYMLGTHLSKYGDMYKEDFGSENQKNKRNKWKE